MLVSVGRQGTKASGCPPVGPCNLCTTFLKGVIVMTGTMRRLILATIAVFLLAGPAVAGSMEGGKKTDDQSMQKHDDTMKKEEDNMMEKGEMKKDSDEMMKDESMGGKEKMEMKESHEKKGM
jgi:hypothetical protein